MLGVILSFAVIILLILHSNVAANGKDCILNAPVNDWQKSAVSLDRAETYCIALIDDVNQNSTLYRTCKTDIRQYFELNYENDKTVKEFVKTCRVKMGKESFDRCTKIIIHFNQRKLCWNMGTAEDLFSIFHKNYFLTDEDLKKIKLKYSDFIYFKNAKVYLSFSGPLIEDDENSMENKMDLFFYYKELRDDIIKRKNIESTACGFHQIFGIYKYYLQRKLAESKGKTAKDYILKNLSIKRKNELADLYNKICLENKNNSLRYYWPSYILERLADNAKLMNFKTFEELLNKCYDITKAGWYCPDRPSSHWPVEFVLSKIMKKGSDEIDEDAVTTIFYAISFGFTPETFDEYVNLFITNDAFNNADCQRNILLHVMFERDAKSVITSRARVRVSESKSNNGVNYDYWVKIINKKNFNEHLKLLLEIYDKSEKQDLADPELLKICLHGHTQNTNGSFNNVVWSKTPKNVFVRLNTIKLGVYDAVLSFNDGFSCKLDIYKKLGLKLCKKSVNALRGIDCQRLKKADKAAENITEEARTQRRLKRKALEDDYEKSEGPTYLCCRDVLNL